MADLDQNWTPINAMINSLVGINVNATAIENSITQVTNLDICNVQDHGASGSSQKTTGTINASSASLTLAAALDFVNGQGISVIGAGTACALTTPASLTVTPTGSAGSTSYTYAVAAIDASGGITSVRSTSTSTGNATLNTTNYNALTVGAVSNAKGYLWYRTAGGGSQGLIKVTSATTINDTGLSTITTPFGVPSTAPASATAQTLYTTISSGAGTTTLTLAATATTSVSSVSVAHDDTPAFTSAFAASPNVFVPSGDYNVTSLTMGNQMSLTGVGVKSVLHQTLAGGNFITVGSAGTGTNCQSIQKLAFAPNASVVSGYQIYLIDTAYAKVEDIIITSAYGSAYGGIDVENGTGTATLSMFTVLNKININYTKSQAIMIGNNGASSVYRVNDINLEKINIGPCYGGGVYIYNAMAVMANQVTVGNTLLYGLAIVPGATQSVSAAYFVNCQIDTCTPASNFAGQVALIGSGHIGNVKFTACWSATSRGYGIQINNANIDGLIFSDCDVANNYRDGINLNAGTNISFIGLNVNNNSTVGSNSAHGLNIAASVSGFQVIGGVYGAGGIVKLDGGTNNQGYGIAIGGTNDHFTIITRAPGNVSGTLYQGASIGSDKYIDVRTG